MFYCEGLYLNLMNFYFLFWLLSLSGAVAQALYDPQMFQLGDNLVANPQFSTPTIPNSRYVVIFGNDMPGWACNPKCQLQSVQHYCNVNSKNCTLKWPQAVELDSGTQFNIISQNISLPQDGQYLIHLEWSPAWINPLGKQFAIRVNSTSFANITTNSTDYYFHEEQFLLQAPKGQILLQIQMLGTPDQLGVLFSNIKVQRLVPAEEQFSLVLEYSEDQKAVAEALNGTLGSTSGGSVVLHNLILSAPISIFFLSFLNFFSFSSIYVLLNFPIPSTIYNNLSVVYEQLNSSILSLMGITVFSHPLSDERVNRKRGVHFGVKSDLWSGQGATLLVLVANIVLIFFIQWLLSFLRKNNPLRKYWQGEKFHMASGQIINVVMPLTLPWTFVMLENGIKNFYTKINAACYLIIYFMGLFYPIYYFFQLLGEQEGRLIDERNARRRERENNVIRLQTKPQPWGQREQSRQKKEKKQEKNGKSKSKKKEVEQKVHEEKKGKKDQKPSDKGQLKEKKKGKKKQLCKDEDADFRWPAFNLEVRLPPKKIQPQKPLTFGQLITIEILEQWHLTQANFLLPSLVLLQNPLIFLLVVQFYTLLGAFIAFKKRETRVNSFTLALYPFFFNFCFILFYISPWESLLIKAELACLAIFLLGVVHHILTMVYQMLVFFWNICKTCRRRNQIDNEPQRPVVNQPKKEIKAGSHFKPPPKRKNSPQQFKQKKGDEPHGKIGKPGKKTNENKETEVPKKKKEEKKPEMKLKKGGEPKNDKNLVVNFR